MSNLKLKTPSGGSVQLTPTDTASNVVLTLPASNTTLVGADSLASPAGSSLAGYLPTGVGAVATTVQAKLRESVSVKDFGAVGDGVTDDTVSIQAALNYVGASGGGIVFLPPAGATGTYRVTSTLRIPSYTTLEGTNPLVFPFSFNNGIVADFANPMQWVIESKTTSGGNNIPYNAVLTEFPDGATYNCGVRNLRIGAVNTTPYGGIRMQGCFGPIIENVSIAEVGCGFLLNESLGGRWSVNSRALYYGMALWNDCNANEISLYATQSPPATNVPAAYQLPFMSALNGQLVPTYKFASNAPYEYSTGLIIGASAGYSTQTNTINATVETFSTSVFLINTKSAVFTNLYIEGSTNDVKYALLAANSTFNALGLHTFMSGTGTLLDVGNDTRGLLNIDGISFFNNFGSVYVNSKLTVYNYNNPSPSLPALNVQFANQDAPWIAPTLTNSWVNAGGTNASASYRKNERSGNVELKGFIVNGVVGSAAFTLPVGYRPYEKRWFQVLGGVVYVNTNGDVVPDAPTVNQASLDNIQFVAEQ